MTALTKKQVAATKFAAADKHAEAIAAAAIAAATTPEVAEVAAPAPAKKTTAGKGLSKAKAATKAPSKLVTLVAGAAPVAEKATPAPRNKVAKAVIADALAVVAPKAKRVSKKAAVKAEAPAFEPSVVKDENNHTAIAVSADARTVELIPMDSAGMAVIKLSRDRFAAEYRPVDGYPVSKASRVYLTQTIAMDPKAREVLELLAASEADKPIASGALVALMSRHDEAAAAEARATAAAAPKADKPAKAVKAPKAEREVKPLGHRLPAEATKTIVAGDVKVESKIQPGSFRAARHNYIVSMAGKTVADVLGASTLEGKRGIAFRDVQFAVSHGFIKLA